MQSGEWNNELTYGLYNLSLKYGETLFFQCLQQKVILNVPDGNILIFNIYLLMCELSLLMADMILISLTALLTVIHTWVHING